METVPLWYYLKHGGSLGKLDWLLSTKQARLVYKSGRAHVELAAQNRV